MGSPSSYFCHCSCISINFNFFMLFHFSHPSLSSSAKYSTGTSKYFAKSRSLSNFGLLRPVFQSESTDCAIPVSFATAYAVLLFFNNNSANFSYKTHTSLFSNAIASTTEMCYTSVVSQSNHISVAYTPNRCTGFLVYAHTILR